MGNGNWEHFGKFKSISAIPTSNQGIDVVWSTIVASGSSVAIQGGPGLNPDGSPADGPITLAHSFARQWGDKTAYHVGANYAEQEGDTIVVSLGNSSTKRKGWANNVTDGISFATTTGGSFATTGGFSVNTIGGGRVQTFIGLEVNCSEAITCKIAGGGVFEVFKTSKLGSAGQETSIVGTLTEICTSVNETVGSFRRVSLVDDDISGSRSISSSAEYHNVAGLFSLSASCSQENFGNKDGKYGFSSETVAGTKSTFAGTQSHNSLGPFKIC